VPEAEKWSPIRQEFGCDQGENIKRTGETTVDKKPRFHEEKVILRGEWQKTQEHLTAL
jgi:hypothetical protein